MMPTLTKFAFSAAAFLLAASGGCRAGESALTFTARPTARVDGDSVRIEFAVDRATDVEVAILEAKGQVVRHLAAGMLGPNAPAPLKANSLEQAIAWDRKDDLGNLVEGAARARVRIGSAPRLDKIVGWDGNTLIGPVTGLTVGKGGEVYVLQTVMTGLAEVRVFDAKGRYARTILPYPANIPKERAASLGQLELDGERLPVAYSAGWGIGLAPWITGMCRQNMAWNPRGSLVMVGGPGAPRHLVTLAPDGGAPDGLDFTGPKIQNKSDKLTIDFDHLAVSPDGRQIYLVLFDGRPRHAVFRLSWEDKTLGAPFLGKEGEPGADQTHLNDPQGLATDREGRLYVCDRGNNRVAIFSPDGRFVGQFAASEPEQIAVHAKSGAIYVLSRRKPDKERQADIGSMSQEQYRAYMKAERERKAKAGPPPLPVLTKFSAWGKEPPKQMARLESGIDLIALDPEAEPAKIWAGMGWSLVPIADRGDAFEAGEAVTNRNGMLCPTYLAADPARGRVLVREQQQNMKNDNKPIRALDLKTGAKTPFLTLCDVALDGQGNIYGTGGWESNAILRYDPEGKPLPFAATGTNKLDTGPWYAAGVDFGRRSQCVDRRGNIYFIRSHKSAPEAGIGARVDVFGPDGRRKQAGFIDGLGYGDCGIGVDAHGNVYVGMSLKPADAVYPKELTGKVPDKDWTGASAERDFPWRLMSRNPYLWNYGSVVKFGPEGGKVYGNGYHSANFKPREGQVMSPLLNAANAPPDARVWRSGYARRELRTAGAQWAYLGASSVPHSEDFHHQCSCVASQLAVDPYGRVFGPDSLLFSLEMLDTNGNRIHRIGRYGNADSAGPGSAVPGPEIAFACPNFVSAAEGKIYVSDPANHRVTVVRFDYAAEETCEVK